MFRLAYLACLLAACTDASEPPIDFAFCAEQHTEGAVVVCDKAFDSAPRVHLPPDDGVTVHAAVGGSGLVSRDGQVVDRVTFDTTGTNADVPAGFAMPSYEFLEHVYAITGQTVRPILRITPEVLDGNLLGTWEGTLSRRVAVGEYDEATRIPIRVTFDHFADAQHEIHRWNPYEASDPILTYALRVQGTIANATQPITLASGTCAPSLASLGDGNPRLGMPDAVEFMREVAMHAPGDKQLLFEGWMGPIDHAMPAALIAVTPDASEYSAYPHGSPNGQHLDDLARVATGGGACTP